MLLEAARLANIKADQGVTHPGEVPGFWDDDPQPLQPDAEPSAAAAVPETSTPGESQSNGAAERAVRMVQDHARTLKLCLEDRVGAKIPSTHPVLDWLVQYSAILLTKCQPNGEDLKTGYERLHGEPANDRVPEFGEVVYLFVPARHRYKWDARWRVGVFLGRS